MPIINDQFIEQALVSIDDRGFLFGDGVFETILARASKLIFFKEHLQRLQDACHALMLTVELTPQKLAKQCINLLERQQLHDTDAAIRITITAGLNLQRGLARDAGSQPNLIITAHHYNKSQLPLPRLQLSEVRRFAKSPLCQLKTLNYLDSILCYSQAQAQGFDDGIMLNHRGELLASSYANLFFIRDQELLTPAVDCGIRPGVVRECLLNLSRQLGISTTETALVPSMLGQMTAAFQSNSLLGLQAIAAIGQITFAKPTPPLLQQLQQAYQQVLMQPTTWSVTN